LALEEVPELILVFLLEWDGHGVVPLQVLGEHKVVLAPELLLVFLGGVYPG